MSTFYSEQLQFDINSQLDLVKKVEDNNFKYYPWDSYILNDQFSIKINYKKRTYIIKWKYHINAIRVFSDVENIQKAIWFINIQKVFAYSWFIYSLTFLSKKEKQIFTKFVFKILSSPDFNQNLENN